MIRWEPSLTLSTNLCGSKICAFSSVHQFPTLLSLIDVFDHCLRSCNTIFENSLAVVEKYFTRISEQKYSHKTMLDLFNQFSKEDEIQPKSYVIPRNLLSKWMAGGELNVIIFLFRFIAIMFLYIQLSLHWSMPLLECEKEGLSILTCFCTDPNNSRKQNRAIANLLSR